MPDPFARPVLLYRWIVFLLAAGYCVYQLVTASYEAPGGPFRFLTNWALLASFYSASRMLAYSERRIERRHLTTASATAVINAIVVLQYWRLYIDDPANVQGNGPIVWWLDYYIHLVGPLLQWIDALFIAGAFRKHRAGLLAVGALVLVYVAWAELFVGPMNTRPTGTVTSGLPYPFLNNMEPPARAVFYVINLAVALGLYGLFAGLAALIRRRFRPRALP